MTCAECGKPLAYAPTPAALPPFHCPNVGPTKTKCYARWLWRTVYHGGKRP